MWLAVSDDSRVKVSGRYFHHQKEVPHNPEADDVQLQERFLSLCEEITGVSLARQVFNKSGELTEKPDNKEKYSLQKAGVEPVLENKEK